MRDGCIERIVEVGGIAMLNMPTSTPEQFYQGAPLLLVPDVPAAVHLARREDVPTGVRIFFWVKDVNALFEEVRKRGTPIAVPIATRPYGVRDFSIHDPNGVMVVLGQDWE
jgi:uncharacterized glyoxalase superfamily protein PhnB